MEYLPSGVTYNQRNYSMQPYRFCGKEEVTLHGFDMYDSQARWQYSLIPRFSSMDPLAEDYYHLSPYAYCAGDPVNLVDPDGRYFDEWTIHLDGTLTRYVNDNSYDEFYIENNDKTLEFVGKLDKSTTKDNVSLVEFPASGIGFTRYGDIDVGGDHFIQPSAAAALFGAVNEIYEYDSSIIIQFGDMSSFDGGKPGIAHTGGKTSHLNGRNVDIRYIRTDRQLSRVEVDDTSFDKESNQILVNSLRKFGFKDILSYERSKDNWLLQNTRSYKGHHHHLHIQGFRPNINIIK